MVARRIACSEKVEQEEGQSSVATHRGPPVIWIETGPWTRRIELEIPQEVAEVAQADTMCLGVCVCDILVGGVKITYRNKLGSKP